VTAQEGYYGDNNVYYSGTLPAPAMLFNPSQGVTITILNAGNTGWAATATYSSLTPRTCALFQGPVSPPSPATIEGQVACTP
jgi:hypothetical protein